MPTLRERVSLVMAGQCFVTVIWKGACGELGSHCRSGVGFALSITERHGPAPNFAIAAETLFGAPPIRDIVV